MSNPIPTAALEHHIAILGKTGSGKSNEPRVVPTVADAAYAAGFFDGEGTIFIAANHRAPGARGTIYNMRVTACQVDPTPLAWMVDRWGGSLVQRQYKLGVRRPCYVWNCFARRAAQFLEDVRPYLIIKGDEADIALQFQSSLFNPGVRGHTAEYRAQQESLRQQLMELKRDRERIAV